MRQAESRSSKLTPRSCFRTDECDLGLPCNKSETFHCYSLEHDGARGVLHEETSAPLGIIILADMKLGFLMPPVDMKLLFASYRFGEPLP